ncbi:MAG: NGG1p interacting factor NIF3 [bacterium]
MNLRDFYEKAVQVGIEHDPRGKSAVSRDLEKQQKKFSELKDREKEFFDTDSLRNPYSDSKILHGSGDEEIRAILAGIDMEVGEILLADWLRARGKAVDLILSHHPEGSGIANLYHVLEMQSDILNKYGVPIHIAESLMEGRIKEVQRRLLPLNHTRAVDAARLLNIPFICLHTPADNMVASFLQDLFDAKKPDTLADIVDLLTEIPEYREAGKIGAGPRILLGSDERRAGRIFVDMTGGTEGAKDVFESLSSSGVNTIVGMHINEEHRKEAEKHHMNVVIAGHIASDNLGINLLLDRVIGGEEITLHVCSGFRRIRRG